MTLQYIMFTTGHSCSYDGTTPSTESERTEGRLGYKENLGK